MAIKTKEELMASLRARIGDDTADEAITLIEDFSDTFDDMSARAKPDGVDWKAKCEETEATWRKKYRDRFYNTDVTETEKETEKENYTEKRKSYSYESLFKEE